MQLTELQERKTEEEKKAAERIQVKENEITELTSKLASERKAAQAEYEQLKEVQCVRFLISVVAALTIADAPNHLRLQPSCAGLRYGSS